MRKSILSLLFLLTAVIGFSEVSPQEPFISGLQVCGAISIDADGNIWISDWSGQRVGIYDSEGRLVRTIEGIGDPSGNVFDDKGNFYVSSYSYRQVWKIDPSGRKRVYADGFDVPAGLAWIDGCLYVANRDAGELVRIEKNGRKTVLAEDLPQPVSCLKLKDGALIISCLSGSPRILEKNGKLSVLIPEITSSGINIIPDEDDSFIFCVISDGTVERVTLGGKPGNRTVKRTVLASGFHTPIGVARLPDGNIIFDAWHEGVFILEMNAITINTAVKDIISDPELAPWGRLLFPANEGYWSGDTLGDLQLTWYSHINPGKTVEIVQYMKQKAQAGEKVFYDIYAEAEKKADPAKRNTGLFFFRGNPGAKFAVCNAGGGFAYVGAMHDSFPHALELSKKGYNAFALIYRPGWQTACQDLARAISFIFDHAHELKVDTSCYSLWGGSAGARMAAILGSYGTVPFGEKPCPGAVAVFMQYTGHSEWKPSDPPTFVCVGDRDGIASWRGMKNRLDQMARAGIPTEFHVYKGLGHGFGLGQGTGAEGWLDLAVKFWEEQQ